MIVKSGVADRIAIIYAKMLGSAANYMKGSPDSFSDIETIIDENTILYKDGTLGSFFFVEGMIVAATANSHAEMLEGLYEALAGAGNAHDFLFFFEDENNTTHSKKDLDRRFAPINKTLVEMGIPNLTKLNDADVAATARYASMEKCIFGVFTSPAAVMGGEYDPEKIKKHYKTNYFNTVERMYSRHVSSQGLTSHTALYKNIKVKYCGNDKRNPLRMRPIPAVEMLEIQRDIYAGTDKTESDYRLPHFPDLSGSSDDNLTSVIREGVKEAQKQREAKVNEPCRNPFFAAVETAGGHKFDAPWLLPKADQFICAAGNVEYYDLGWVRVGNKVFMPMSIELPPNEPTPFNVLFSSLKKHSVPWRCCMRLSLNGMEALNYKQYSARLARHIKLGKKAIHNNWLMKSAEQFDELVANNDIPVRWDMVVCTWGDVREGDAALEERRKLLATSVTNWSQAACRKQEGDLTHSYASTIPGMLRKSIAEPAYPPIYDALRIAPLTRPAALPDNSGMLVRSRDGKACFIQLTSLYQASWVWLVAGSMGSGKSMMLQALKYALFNDERNNNNLPFLVEIDVGPTGRGTSKTLMRYAHPKLRSEFIDARLKNSKEFSKNIMDTPVGMRFPFAARRGFVSSFIALLLSSEQVPAADLTGPMDVLVNMAYRFCAEDETARRFTPGSAENDVRFRSMMRYLKTSGFMDDIYNESTTWWEVVDYLSANGQWDMARVANTKAVPNIQTLLQVLNQEEFLNVYSERATSVHIPSYLQQKLTEVSAQYPVMVNDTVFDLSSRRYINLDVNELLDTGVGDSKIPACFYLWAMDISTAHFWLNEEQIKEIPDDDKEGYAFGARYKDYHAKLIREITSSPKAMIADEIHRVMQDRANQGDNSGKTDPYFSIIEGLFTTRQREARKWFIFLALASQDANDFSPAMVKLSSNNVILGGSSEALVRAGAKRFGFPQHMHHTLVGMSKPGKAGSTFGMLSRTDLGVYANTWMLTMSLEKIWASNTNRRDSFIRDRFFEHEDILDEELAMKTILQAFPDGTAESRMSQLKDEYAAESGANVEEFDDLTEEEQDSILEKIVQSLVRLYQRLEISIATEKEKV